jgi:hypothetical protein
MKRVVLLSFVALVFLLSFCDPDTGLLTIFRKVLSDNDIKIGLFARSPKILADGEYIYDSSPSVDFPDPIVITTPDANGDYSITFPDDISQVCFLRRIHGIWSISNQAE